MIAPTSYISGKQKLKRSPKKKKDSDEAYSTYLPEGDYDMFNDGKINVLTKKVSMLEKAKAKAEVELKAVKKDNAELKKAANNHAEIIDQLTDDLEEQNKVIDRIT
ncbi:hypothetical protein Hanom_Chr06g00528741 [Helianthus anomalus]